MPVPSRPRLRQEPTCSDPPHSCRAAPGPRPCSSPSAPCSLRRSWSATAPAAAAADTLLSQGKPATASSKEGDGLSAGQAFDGNLTGTRWASQWSDPQWIQVDLGKKANLSRAVLTWEGAYGKGYEIQASDNGTDWTTLKKVTDGDGGTDDLALTGVGRYVRMLGTARPGGYGYSLWEFQVYGSEGATQPPPGGAVKVTGTQGACSSPSADSPTPSRD